MVVGRMSGPYLEASVTTTHPKLAAAIQKAGPDWLFGGTGGLADDGSANVRLDAAGSSAILPLDVPVELAGFDSDADGATAYFLRLFLTMLLVGVPRALLRLLEGSLHIGPLRALPPRNFSPEALSRPGRWIDGLGAWDALWHREESVLDQVNVALSSLGIPYSLRRQLLVERPTVDTAPPSAVRSSGRPGRGTGVGSRGKAPTGGGERGGVPGRDPNSGGGTRSGGSGGGTRSGGSGSARGGIGGQGRAKPNIGTPSTTGDRGTAAGTRVSRPVSAAAGVRRLLLTDSDGVDLLLCDVGIGISQVIPVVASVLLAEGVVMLEQPELHVHPVVQVELGDLFIRSLERRKQIIVETHSEHIVLRLLRRIRETHDNELPKGSPRLTPELLSVLYVETNKEGVSVRRLRVDANGEFEDRWPHGFFAERVAELF
jgi:hypothetical protein